MTQFDVLEVVNTIPGWTTAEEVAGILGIERYRVANALKRLARTKMVIYQKRKSNRGTDQFRSV